MMNKNMELNMDELETVNGGNFFEDLGEKALTVIKKAAEKMGIPV